MMPLTGEITQEDTVTKAFAQSNPSLLNKQWPTARHVIAGQKAIGSGAPNQPAWVAYLGHPLMTRRGKRGAEHHADLPPPPPPSLSSAVSPPRTSCSTASHIMANACRSRLEGSRSSHLGGRSCTPKSLTVEARHRRSCSWEDCHHRNWGNPPPYSFSFHLPSPHP